MKRSSVLFVSIAAVLALGAAQAAPASDVKEAPITLEQAALDDGRALYAELCASCHGIDARGNGPAAPALATPAPDLTTLAMHNDGVFPAIGVQKAITGQTNVVAHGTLEMPVWGHVLADVRPDTKPGQRWAFARLRILALTEYIESLQVESEMK